MTASALHLQMIAVVLWASAHLLLNGDSRSVVLFGGLLSWAALEIVFINKRDAQWTKPEPVSWLVEIIGVVITLVLIVGVIHGHQYLSGIPLRA